MVLDSLCHLSIILHPFQVYYFHVLLNERIGGDETRKKGGIEGKRRKGIGMDCSNGR